MSITRQVKIFILFVSMFCVLYPSLSMAQSIDNVSDGNIQQQSEIYFRPNVEIPGMGTYFTAVGDGYLIDNVSIINYIRVIYSYSAILAGVIAMFMMVFAAYQWLMAAGSADKISKAKETISGTLLGLTLLFGGYLLLSQISDRLVNFSALDVNPIVRIDALSGECTNIMANLPNADSFSCGNPYPTSTESGRDIICVSSHCENDNPNITKECISKDEENTDYCASAVMGGAPACECQRTDCAYVAPGEDSNDCSGYILDEHCRLNLCNGYRYVNPNTPAWWNDCGIDENNLTQRCESLYKVQCMSDAWCNQGAPMLKYEYYCDLKDDPKDNKCKRVGF